MASWTYRAFLDCLPVVCHLQYRSMGSKKNLFILHGSKKIVKKFQAKIQSGTWPKYSLKNTKNSKKSKILRFSLQTTIVNSRLNSLENEGICRSGAVNNCCLQWKSQNFGFFWVLVFFKLYFGHVPDCISAWKIFTIFFDPCRINKKIFEPIGRYWRLQTICALDVKLLVRPTLHKTQFFFRHPVIRFTLKVKGCSFTTKNVFPRNIFFWIKQTPVKII